MPVNARRPTMLTRVRVNVVTALLLLLVMATACARVSRAQSLSTTRADDLALTFVDPRGTPAKVTAVLLSGDGGWAELIKTLADGLAARGIAVVGVNSRALLSSPKTPEATTAAVVRAIEASRERTPGHTLLIVGYSRGADIAPFIANRLPRLLREQLAGVAMLGLATTASFEFHWTDLVKDTPRPTDLAIKPELERLRGTPMVCVFGSDEKSSGCRDAPDGLLRRDERQGGHHFDGDFAALVQDVMQLLEKRTKE